MVNPVSVIWDRTPILQHLLIVGAYTLLLQLPAVFWRKYVAVTALAALIYRLTLVEQHLTPGSQYLQAISFASAYVYALDLFLVNEYPETTDYQPRKETLQKVQDAPPFSRAKLDWAFRRSCYVNRGTGWVTASKTKLRAFTPIKSKIRFALGIVAQTVLQLVVAALGMKYISRYNYVAQRGRDADFPSIFSEVSGPLELVLVATCMAFYTYAGLSLFFNTASLFAVLCNIVDIEDYTPLFDMSKMFTSPPLKTFWNEAWHQLLYRSYSLCRALTDKLFGTSPSGKILAVYLTFLLNGTLHWFANTKMAWYRTSGDAAYRPMFLFLYWCVTLRVENRWNRFLAKRSIQLPKPVCVATAIVWFVVVQTPAAIVLFHDQLRADMPMFIARSQ
ncbi:hypothetical protein OGAPHI_006587 [Ogataea philodendri]|uniref:Wax synthase domain-containing protein n=1 Tax=Ogataea philodendri TaxID=1378263 RepID=A0A9P8NX94_9ASCO|nr:uncharacterized protein OGAPHI_006587 [Ogataea philodendri]KAH3661180.1 hypothetical protein OGAPHI_006587 [Ogataea philodendri]